MTFPRMWSAPWRILTGQQHARRNALMACTALAELRRERLEVEEFLAEHAGHRALRTPSPDGSRPAAHSA